MARKPRYKHITITPGQGGQLVGSASDDIAGSSNYTEKLNFRRDTDGELRREGWELYDPSGNAAPLDSEFPIRLLHQFSSSTGEAILIAAAGGTIYRLRAGTVGYVDEGYGDENYFTGTEEKFWWEEIYSGLNHMDSLEEDGTLKNPFEGGAYRWEAVTVLNNVVISNGVDLPLIYRAEWDRAHPIYSLREQGIVSCGTIASYQDRLFIADVTTIIDGYDTWFIESEDPYGDIRAHSLYLEGNVKIQRFQYRMIYSMEQNPRYFDTTESGGLPATLVVSEDGEHRIKTSHRFAMGVYDEGKSLVTDTTSYFDEEAVLVQSEDFGIKTEDEKFALESTGLNSRLFLKFGGYSEYFIESLYQNDRMYPIAQYNWNPEFYNEARTSDGIVNNDTQFWIDAAKSVDKALEYRETGNIIITKEQYEALPEYTYGEDSYQPSSSSSQIAWRELFLGRDLFEPDIGKKEFIITNRNDDNVGLLSYDFPVWSLVEAYPTGTTVRYGAVFYRSTQSVNAGEDAPEENSKWVVADGYLNPGEYSVLVTSYLNQLYSQAASREFADDGTRILRMVPLADKLVVYRDSGYFFISRSLSSDLNIFSVEPRYRGGRVADYRHTIVDLDGKRHLFLGSTGVYSISRASSEPQPVSVFELGPTFWKSIPPEYAEYVYACDNPVTRELFFNVPLGVLQDGSGNYVDVKGSPVVNPELDWGVLAYDYISKTLSTIDASFTASAYIRKPRLTRVGPEQTWFVMGVHAVGEVITKDPNSTNKSTNAQNVYVGSKYRPDANHSGVLVRYGYGPPELGSTDPYRSYTRLGYGYKSVLRSGLIDFGDSFSDKEVRAYVLELSNKFGTTPVEVKISTTTSVQGTEEVETLSEVQGREEKYVTLNQVQDENMIPLYVRAPYIRDEIVVMPEYEGDSYGEGGYYLDGYMNDENYIKANPVKVVGRTYDVSGVDTRQATQSIGQG